MPKGAFINYATREGGFRILVEKGYGDRAKPAQVRRWGGGEAEGRSGNFEKIATGGRVCDIFMVT